MISTEQGALLGAAIGILFGWPEYTWAPWQVAIDIVIGDTLLGAVVVAIACRLCSATEALRTRSPLTLRAPLWPCLPAGGATQGSKAVHARWCDPAMQPIRRAVSAPPGPVLCDVPVMFLRSAKICGCLTLNLHAGWSQTR